MTYEITYLLDSEYCRLRPSDHTCHQRVELRANNKTHAAMEFHRIVPGGFDTQNNRLPIIWEINEL